MANLLGPTPGGCPLPSVFSSSVWRQGFVGRTGLQMTKRTVVCGPEDDSLRKSTTQAASNDIHLPPTWEIFSSLPPDTNFDNQHQQTSIALFRNNLTLKTPATTSLKSSFPPYLVVTASPYSCNSIRGQRLRGNVDAHVLQCLYSMCPCLAMPKPRYTFIMSLFHHISAWVCVHLSLFYHATTQLPCHDPTQHHGKIALCYKPRFVFSLCVIPSHNQVLC